MKAADLVEPIRTAQYPVLADEYDLQAALAKVLTDAGHRPLREVPVPGGRIDLLVWGVAIEVKVKGTADALGRQLRRYAESDLVTELLVVTTRVAHQAIPRTIGGKRVTVVQIGGIL